MSRNQLSPGDVVKLTSRIVAAFCRANRAAAHELPAIIRVVGQKLEDLNAMSLSGRGAEPDASKTSRTARPHGAVTKADRILAQVQVSSTRGFGRGIGPSAALGKRRMTTSNLLSQAISPKAVAAVSSAYQDAMTEVARGSGYLPSRSSRETMQKR
jgi:hypothetical protein